MSDSEDRAAKKSAPGVAFHFDVTPLKLGGWAAHEQADRDNDDISLRLMAGDVTIGTLRRDRQRADVAAHLGRALPPCGFNIQDHGLRAFAELSGVTDLAVAVESKAGGRARHALHPARGAEHAVSPLGSRAAPREWARLGDLWLDSARDLSLRFDAADHVAQSIDAYQCPPDGAGRLIQVAADRKIAGLVSIATMKLLNPYLPVLLVYKGADGAIDAIDIIPFPSLARGGSHAGERTMIGRGGDDLVDTAAVSATLLRALLARSARPADHVAAIHLDEALHTGLEPVLNPDLLAFIASFLRVAVKPSPDRDGHVPEAIAEAVARVATGESQPGHALHLPADSIPTLSALIEPLPPGLSPQRVVGAMGVVDADRHGRLWSVWQPPLGDWLDGLQAGSRQRVAPMLDIAGTAGAGTGREAAVTWPLSLAVRPMPARVSSESPYELSSELPASLLRNRALPDPMRLSVVVHCQRNNMAIAPLLESLVRQERVEHFDLILMLPPGRANADVSHFLSSRLADRHVVVELPAGRGKLEQLAAVREHIKHDHVLVLDGDTTLPDPRTLATLRAMLDAKDVASVGCMVRSGQGKTAAQGGGYSPSAINLRAMPAFAFGLIDPAVFRQPATYPVIANSLAVLMLERAAIDQLDTTGSTAVRPEIDDLLLGIQLIANGGLNLCTSIVSASSSVAPAAQADAALSIPYRLAPETLSRLMASTAVVQALR